MKGAGLPAPWQANALRSRDAVKQGHFTWKEWASASPIPPRRGRAREPDDGSQYYHYWL